MRSLLLAVCLLATPAFAADDTYSPPGFTWNGQGANTLISIAPPTMMTIACGLHGSVVVSLIDGSAKFTGDCDPDDAARMFWSAVARMAPMKGATK